MIYVEFLANKLTFGGGADSSSKTSVFPCQ